MKPALIALAVASTLLAVGAYADEAKYKALAGSQTGVAKAVVCLPFIDRFRAAIHVMYGDALREKNSQKIKGLANSLFQNTYRYHFVEALMTENRLDDLYDQAYMKSAGIRDRQTISPCYALINEMLEDPKFAGQKASALKKAQHDVREATNQFQ